MPSIKGALAAGLIHAQAPLPGQAARPHAAGAGMGRRWRRHFNLVTPTGIEPVFQP